MKSMKKWTLAFFVLALGALGFIESTFADEAIEENSTPMRKETPVTLSGWVQQDDSWYYYEDNQLHYGWLQVGDAWFYLDPTTGKMATGTIIVGSDTFYLHPTLGNMQKNWIQLDGTWYYFHPVLGHLQKNWLLLDNTWYYLQPETGGMLTGWAFVNNQWYYLHPTSGAMMTGWQLVNNNWHYLQPQTGAMATGWQFINGKWYYLNEDGSMKTGWLKDDNDTTYYLKENGEMATGTIVLQGITYWFQQNGVQITSPDAIWKNPTGIQPNLANYSNLRIEVSISAQRIYIYSGSEMIYEIICSTGLPGMDTPKGNFVIQQEKGLTFGGSYGGANYYRSFLNHGVYLFHSVPIDGYGNYIPSEGRLLGQRASHGCIRMPVPDAIWFYYGIPYNTPVHIY